MRNKLIGADQDYRTGDCSEIIRVKEYGRHSLRAVLVIRNGQQDFFHYRKA
jgi:hypothetical protein